MAIKRAALPEIDPRVHHCGPSKLREMSGGFLHHVEDNVYIIHADGINGDPTAVLLGYEQFMSLFAQGTQ